MTPVTLETQCKTAEKETETRQMLFSLLQDADGKKKQITIPDGFIEMCNLPVIYGYVHF